MLPLVVSRKTTWETATTPDEITLASTGWRIFCANTDASKDQMFIPRGILSTQEPTITPLGSNESEQPARTCRGTTCSTSAFERRRRVSEPSGKQRAKRLASCRFKRIRNRCVASIGKNQAKVCCSAHLPRSHCTNSITYYSF